MAQAAGARHGGLTALPDAATPDAMPLDPIRSGHLRAPHGFFTRRGGASSGVFGGLNCGPGSSDQAEAVTINRGRVAAAMGVEADAMHGLRQVHSARVAVVDDPAGRPEADAAVTTRPGLVLSVLTADCLPVLFEADGVVAVAHAGWKGLRAGVLEATAAAMREAGAGEIRAAIGPAISGPAYEVGPDLRAGFDDPDADAFFTPGDGDRLQFDLPGYALHRLAAAGVAAEWTGHCTYGDPDRFFSYRRATHRGEADYGRLIAAIRLP